MTFRICLLAAALVAGGGGAELAAAEFREDFAGAAPAASVWTLVRLNDGAVAVEETNGRPGPG